MKKWQTDKELMTLEPKKIKKSLNLKTLISKIPKIPKIMINIPLNKSNINFQKNHKKIFSNFLTNNSFSISNIENTNPNYLFNSLSYSHRSRIYQKKKVPIPQKIKEEKKKYFFSLKKNLNLKNLLISKKSSKNKVNKTESQKNLLKNSKNTYQTKKYLNTKLNFDKIKLINAGITLDKEINSERVRRINTICNKVGAANVLLISVHANAVGNGTDWCTGKGWEAYTTRGKTISDKLADFLYKRADSNLPGRKIREDWTDGDRDKEADFYIIKKAKCPAVLTENFFYDNKDDLKYLTSNEGIHGVVRLHVEGIIDFIKSEK